MSKLLYILVILFSVLLTNIGCTQVLTGKPDFSKRSKTWTDKYRHQDTYIPSADDPKKTIHCQFIIWQKDDGSGSWDENNPEHIKRLRSMIDLINLFWANNQGPSDSVPGVVPLGYSNIEFDIGLKFYQNSVLYDHSGKLCSNFDTLHKTVVALDPDNANYLNIHLVSCACSAGGCTNILGSHRFGDQTVIMNSNHAASTDDWDDARNIAHELGHALGLVHLYNGTGPDEEPGNSSNIDFLDDAMFANGVNGCKPGKGCTHCYNPGGGCDPYLSKTDLCDNNIMGGSSDYKYLSPKQVGRCHRNIAVTNVSKYTTGYSTTPWVVSENETWDFEIKFYQDILIEPGDTLEIKGKVYLVDNASIIVKPGAVLIINGGVITNGGNNFPGSDGLWKEIRVYSGKVKTKQDRKRIYRKGEVILKNGGTIEKCGKGILYGK